MASIACALSARTIERFEAGIDRSGGPDACHLWTRSTSADGYGWVKSREHRFRHAHRLAYALANGGVPEGMWVLHRCDVPACCNPRHLFAGTCADNNADMKAKGRSRPGIAAPERRSRGERHHNSRLTDDLVREIRRRTAAGEQQRSIARRLGVGPGAVAHVQKGRRWQHVT